MTNLFASCLLGDRNEIEDLPDTNKRYNTTGAGLCNQLFSLTNAIIKAVDHGFEFLVIDCFFCSFNNGKIVPISRILDLKKTNEKLQQHHFPITLLDRLDIKCEIIGANYGDGKQRNVDVLQTLFKLPESTILNNGVFQCDPAPGVVKTLSIQCSVNDIYRFTYSFYEYNTLKLLTLDHLQHKIFSGRKGDFAWYKSRQETFEIILSLICFSSEFYEIVDRIAEKYQLKTKTINVVHFRGEEDAIKHWSVQNHLEPLAFQQLLCTKYQEIFEKYLCKDDMIYLLANEHSYLSTMMGLSHSSWTVMSCSREEKDALLSEAFGSLIHIDDGDDHRELRAIIDLLIGIQYSSVFVGCHSLRHQRGSSFSFVIAKLSCLKKCKTQILIDLDSIRSEEEVVHNQADKNSLSVLPRLYVFIHVSTLSCWKQVLSRQLEKIHSSGLYDACDSIQLGVLGDGNLDEFLFKYPKLTILFQSLTLAQYERPTLQAVHQRSVNLAQIAPLSCIFYLHTKGVTRPNNINVTHWSELMEYFIIEKWKDCVSVLRSTRGVDICGVNYRTNPVAHFSGNFWCATARYIATLCPEIGPSYIEPELWINSGHGRHHCFHKSTVNHYDQPYPRHLYVSQ
jgi:hypothetical protein